MKLKYQLSLLIITTSLMTGCGGKNFTMQEYADKWFNDKPKEEVKEETVETKVEEKAEPKKEAVAKPKENLHVEKEETKTDLHVETKSEVKQAKTVVTKPKPKPKKAPLNNPGKSKVGSTIASSSVNQRDAHMEGQGAMQSGLDTWTKEEWEPAFEGDEKQAKKDEEANHHFTIQHYIDKYSKYNKKEEEEWGKSGKKKPEANYEKMNKMPVIGK